MLKRIVLVLAMMLVATVPALTQEEAEPTWTPTPHYLNPPSLPVTGPRVRRIPGQPGPTPGVWPAPEPRVRIDINGFHFMATRGFCAESVARAIRAHKDLFSGKKTCDEEVRKARAIQHQNEAEDPSYANEPRITPAPTPITGE